MNNQNSGWRNWGDHPVLAFLSLVVAIITIIVFITGKSSLSDFLSDLFPPASPTPVASEPSTEVPQNIDSASESSVKWKEGDELLFEDFENSTKEKWYFSGGEWNIVKDGSGNSVLEGKANSNGDRAEVGDINWSNYALELKVRTLQVSTAAYGETFNIIFRASGDCERYKWNMNKTFTNLGRENPPSCSWSQFQVDNYEPLKEDWSSIRIEVFENNLTGYINGIKLFEVTDTKPVSTGRIGLSISSNAIVHFDDVRVIELVNK